jgi:hypothetical protein
MRFSAFATLRLTGDRFSHPCAPKLQRRRISTQNKRIQKILFIVREMGLKSSENYYFIFFPLDNFVSMF